MIARPAIPTPRVRRMTADDLDTVAGMELQAYEFPWSRSVFRDCLRVGYCCVVLEGDSGLQGYGVMAAAAGEAHLLNLCIRADVRRCGLGRDLLAWLLARAREAGAERIFLEVRPSNLGALALYESEGFERVGVRRGYYRAHGGREDAIVFARHLG